VARELTKATDGLVQQPDQAISGGVDLDGTKLTFDGVLNHVVWAAKGSTVMLVDYVTDQTGPSPPSFGTWVGSQYDRL